MQFLMGSALWWIVGAAVVSIPIIIHLLHRQRTQPVLWGAMIFLRMSVLQQKRRKKVDHWLLMLLRLAVLGVLVALLASPRVKDAALSPLAVNGAADVAFVVDYSMSAQRQALNPVPDLSDADRKAIEAELAAAKRDRGLSPQQEQELRDEMSRWRYATVYRQSIAHIAKFVQSDALPVGSTVSIVLAGRSPELVTPAVPLTKDKVLPYLDQLRDRPPGVSTSSIPAALQKAQEAVTRGSNGRKSVMVFHDGQASAWDARNQTLWEASVGPRIKGVPPAIKIYDVPIEPDTKAANLAVDNLRVTLGTSTDVPAAVVAVNRQVVVKADIRNTGVSRWEREASVRLFVDGVESGSPRTISQLEAGKQETVSFDPAFPTPGSHWFQIVVDAPDALAVDNVATGSVYAWQRVPVLVVGQRVHRTEKGVDLPVPPLEDAWGLISAMRSDDPFDDSKTLVQPVVVGYQDPALAMMSGGQANAPSIEQQESARDPQGLLNTRFRVRARDSRAGQAIWECTFTDDAGKVVGRVSDQVSLPGSTGDTTADSVRGLARAPTPAATRATVTARYVSLSDFAVVVLNNPGDLDPSFQAAVTDYVKSGHGLWVILGPSGNLAEKERQRRRLLGFLNPNGLFPADIQDTPAGDKKTPTPLKAVATGHDILRPISGDGRDSLTFLTTLQWWKLSPREAVTVLVTAQNATNDPLVLERSLDQGRIVLWTTPPDRLSGWNNWSAGQAFSPLVTYTVQYLARGWYDPQKNGQYKAGEPVSWRSPAIRQVGSKPVITLPDGQPRSVFQKAVLVDPTGQASEKPLTGTLRRTVEFSKLDLPGKYELRLPGSDDGTPPPAPIYFAVGPDPREAAPTPLTEEDRKWLTSEEHAFIERSVPLAEIATLTAGAGEPGMNLWPIFAGVLLLFLLFETFMTYRMIRRQSSGTAVLPGAMTSAA
jgi:hypothetical protein